MDDKVFQQKLVELVGAIGTVAPQDRRKLALLVSRIQKRHGELSRTVKRLQESLDYLRVTITYLLFDIEATRREKARSRERPDRGEPEAPV